MVKVFIAVLVGCIAVIIVFQFLDFSNISNATSVSTSLVSDSNTISVAISGEITRSGTYILSLNATLDTLIDAASDVTSNADALAYDTTYIMEDGMSFYIAPKYDNTDVCSLEPIEKVNINEDVSESLQAVNGIGSTIADAIVSYRTANGAFHRLEDIKNVTGIGNATFEKIKNYLVLRSA